jgi:HD-like signal output (HDOD) protein
MLASMIFALIGLFALVAVVGFYFFKKSAQANAKLSDMTDPGLSRNQGQASTHPIGTISGAPTQATPRRAWRPMPEVLREFRFVRLSEIEPEKIIDLRAKLRMLPRPPSALHKLVSTEFLSSATSAELSEIVMGEPEVAVKVIAVSNSPLYGLQQLVGNIDQSVKFLGMNTVRGICLQYILNGSIKPGSPEIKIVYERLWNESALACELCFKLAQLLKLDEPGTFVTQIVLACLGRQATYSLMDPSDVLSMESRGLLDRSRLEQQRLGLASAEIGGLLMEEWDLPRNIINIVKEIDATLVAAVAETSTSRRTRNALCYLCCRIAEELVGGKLTDLGAFDITSQESAEYFHLHGFLELQSLSRAAEFMRSSDVTSSINRMLKTMRVTR